MLPSRFWRPWFLSESRLSKPREAGRQSIPHHGFRVLPCLSSCFKFLQWWAELWKCKPNKQFSPHFASFHCFITAIATLARAVWYFIDPHILFILLYFILFYFILFYLWLGYWWSLFLTDPFIFYISDRLFLLISIFEHFFCFHISFLIHLPTF